MDREQAYVDRLYDLLDAMRREVDAELRRVAGGPTSGTPAGLAERDAFATRYAARARQLEAAETRLCFGRLDLADDERRYVGRLGLSDADGARVLLDWRAPQAAPFYQATPAHPAGVLRRRHLLTDGRAVTGLDDEVLDVPGFAAAGGTAEHVAGQGALLVALDAARTGRMRDIVATIQGEQDAVIRAPMGGVLVVQGGPGTGKTVVALHRAAYLLYARRERIADAGVLVIGPNPVFLRYIDQVLPALGETDVVLATPGRLFPGLEATTDDGDAAAAVKGDARMARVLASAVRDRQRVPDAPRTLDVDGTPVVLEPRDVERARHRARDAHLAHNQARASFVGALLDTLAQRLAGALGLAVDGETRGGLLAALRDAPDVRREVNLCWMPLTPQRLLADLYADPARLAAAAGSLLSDSERKALARDRGAPWTGSDVALLDEAAELLGADETTGRAAAAREAASHAADVSYAREVLASVGGGGIVSAETLASRYAGGSARRDLAERAAGDREWAYGHVVVDEAQELSPMQWRAVMRRCPSRSMTVVGDVAQTSAAAGAQSWRAVLEPHVRGRWRVAELSVNYRTPKAIMELAGRVLDAAGERVRLPSSARDGRWPVLARRSKPGDPAVLAGTVRHERSVLGAGRVAVIVPRARWADALGDLTDALGSALVGTGMAALDTPVAVLTATQAKGLEFDGVIVVEPGQIVAEAVRGVHNLYVALTRPTQRLVVVHSGDLPAGMTGLEPWPDGR